MNTDSIRNALTRKLGPLPAWAWAIIAGIGIYVYRNRSGRLNQPTPLQPSQDNAQPPQDQVTLQPGESVYDPNSGVLTTAPGGDNTDLANAYNALAKAIAAATATTTANPKGGGSEQPVPPSGNRGPRSKPKGKGKHPNENKPHPGRKLTERGHRKPKKKGNATPPKGGNKRPRSGTRIRERLGRPRRTPAPQPRGATPLTPRASANPQTQAANRTRQRPRQPMVGGEAPVQHTAGTHSTQRQHTQPAPRQPARPVRGQQRVSRVAPTVAQGRRGPVTGPRGRM